MSQIKPFESLPHTYAMRWGIVYIDEGTNQEIRLDHHNAITAVQNVKAQRDVFATEKAYLAYLRKYQDALAMFPAE